MLAFIVSSTNTEPRRVGVATGFNQRASTTSDCDEQLSGIFERVRELKVVGMAAASGSEFMQCFFRYTEVKSILSTEN